MEFLTFKSCTSIVIQYRELASTSSLLYMYCQVKRRLCGLPNDHGVDCSSVRV